jgi:hypothetical protein
LSVCSISVTELELPMLFHIFCDLFGNLRVNSKTVKERAYSSLVRPKLESLPLRGPLIGTIKLLLLLFAFSLKLAN